VLRQQLDRTGANFEMCVEMIKMPRARPACCICDRHRRLVQGLVDLVENRASSGSRRASGAKFVYEEIPAELKDEAAEARTPLIEMAVEQDDEVRSIT